MTDIAQMKWLDEYKTTNDKKALIAKVGAMTPHVDTGKQEGKSRQTEYRSGVKTAGLTPTSSVAEGWIYNSTQAADASAALCVHARVLAYILVR